MAFSDLIDTHRSPEVTAAKTSDPGTAAASGQAITDDHDDVITENGITENVMAESIVTENVITENVMAESVVTENVVPENAATEKRIALPKPDTNNITVLTESLPNEPILPWHRFTSPWLEKEDSPTDDHSMAERSMAAFPDDATDSPKSESEEAGEQLTLALDEGAATPQHPPAAKVSANPN